MMMLLLRADVVVGGEGRGVGGRGGIAGEWLLRG